MKEIQNLELAELMDMLSDQTSIYTRLMAERTRDDEFDNAKKMIKLLQAEIEFRKTTLDINEAYVGDKNKGQPGN